ncbi:MAG: phenylacetate--CoA ligase family protein, partial [Syntrophobacteraceae bacterium]|nr:phenylacetate--CoA ligase family protein [Syntrophobacteraceae bacterium]
AVNIYPGQIDHVLTHVPCVGSEYQVHLYRRDDGRDVMVVRVERLGDDCPDGDRQLVELISTEIRKQIMVRAQVEVVDYGTLPRTDRKSKRVFDHRVNGV